MANEAVLMYETHKPIPFTVADGTGIEKGTLLKLTDPMTASASDGADDIVCGIAAEEKIASDGNTKLAVYRGGIFRALAGEAITVGDPLTSHSVANELIVADVNNEQTFGISLETASDTDTFLFELRPWAGQLA
tara:strand:+ start:1009 stop:1410 length:402 start_codon:yes stop_codon:yes gene_type:complete